MAAMVIAATKAWELAAPDVKNTAMMPGIIYHILKLDTGDPERPGKVRDYATHEDFEYDISILGDTIWFRRIGGGRPRSDA